MATYIITIDCQYHYKRKLLRDQIKEVDQMFQMRYWVKVARKSELTKKRITELSTLIAQHLPESIEFIDFELIRIVSIEKAEKGPTPRNEVFFINGYYDHEHNSELITDKELIRKCI